MSWRASHSHICFLCIHYALVASSAQVGHSMAILGPTALGKDVDVRR